MVDHYDRILVAVAGVIALGAAASVHPAVATHQGLGSGSLVATVLLYEILFRNPPTEPSRATATATTASSVIVGVGWVLTVVTFL